MYLPPHPQRHLFSLFPLKLLLTHSHFDSL
jgi:hypothetical protein